MTVSRTIKILTFRCFAEIQYFALFSIAGLNTNGGIAADEPFYRSLLWQLIPPILA